MLGDRALRAIAHSAETIVIYMGVQNLPHIVTQLIEAGLNKQTSTALIRWGTRPEQEQLIGCLGTIVAQMEAANFTAPAIAVVDDVVQLQSILAACRPNLDLLSTINCR